MSVSVDCRRRPPLLPTPTSTSSQERPARRAMSTNARSALRRPGVVPRDMSAMSGRSATAGEANLPPVPHPVVSVVVPTRDRAGYLDVTLSSLADQDFAEPYEVIVVNDGSHDSTAEVIRRHGVRSIVHNPRRGPNAARNAAAQAAESDLIALVDDDVFAPLGWLRELVEGARRHPGAQVFGGPIRARFEGPAPRSCGRELPPITTLDLGAEDV